MLRAPEMLLSEKTETYFCEVAGHRSAQLIQLTEGSTKKLIPLTQFPITFGTAPSCSIVLDDPYVSSLHAKLDTLHNAFVLTDLGSKNGLLMNGSKIKEAWVPSKAIIQLGKSTFQFELKKEKIASFQKCGEMISKSTLMHHIFETVGKIAMSESTIAIYGETGTGKELLARAIHRVSTRRHRPFMVINCGAIPKDLLESELFGHVKGAFTGAERSKIGTFDLADRGTLFLDEIGELPLDLQPKLLRAIEQQEIKPMGANRSHKINVRIISATHRNLPKMIQEKIFREDLYYRLHVIPLFIPPLRDRKEDLSLLIEKYGSGLSFTPNAIQRMMQYDWPGNIRELINTLERLNVVNETHVITERDIHNVFNTALPLPFKTTLVGVERTMLRDFLERHAWNRSATARSLSMPKSTLLGKIKKYQLSPTDSQDTAK